MKLTNKLFYILLIVTILYSEQNIEFLSNTLETVGFSTRITVVIIVIVTFQFLLVFNSSDRLQQKLNINFGIVNLFTKVFNRKIGYIYVSFLLIVYIPYYMYNPLVAIIQSADINSIIFLIFFVIIIAIFGGKHFKKFFNVIGLINLFLIIAFTIVLTRSTLASDTGLYIDLTPGLDSIIRMFINIINGYNIILVIYSIFNLEKHYKKDYKYILNVSLIIIAFIAITYTLLNQNLNLSTFYREHKFAVLFLRSGVLAGYGYIYYKLYDVAIASKLMNKKSIYNIVFNICMTFLLFYIYSIRDILEVSTIIFYLFFISYALYTTVFNRSLNKFLSTLVVLYMIFILYGVLTYLIDIQSFIIAIQCIVVFIIAMLLFLRKKDGNATSTNYVIYEIDDSFVLFFELIESTVFQTLYEVKEQVNSEYKVEYDDELNYSNVELNIAIEKISDLSEIDDKYYKKIVIPYDRLNINSLKLEYHLKDIILERKQYYETT